MPITLIAGGVALLAIGLSLWHVTDQIRTLRTSVEELSIAVALATRQARGSPGDLQAQITGLAQSLAYVAHRVDAHLETGEPLR